MTTRSPSRGSARAAEAPAGPGALQVLSLRGRVTRDLQDAEALAELRRFTSVRDTRVWVDLTAASPGLVGQVGEILGLHPLLIEDLTERDQRAKLDQVDALETWAASKAASIMVGIFLAAALVTLAAAVPALILRGGRTGGAETGGDVDDSVHDDTIAF